MLKIFLLILFLLLSACTTIPTPEIRRETSMQLIKDAHWKSFYISTEYFYLQSFIPAVLSTSNNLLTIYIEGDGLAWIKPTRISSDPTPINPIALKLALQHPKDKGMAVYLARPCQYVIMTKKGRNCDNTYWTNKRFAQEVIQSTNTAINQLKKKMAAEKIQLVGFSGGAAVAALLAAQRNDVVLLITIAGNLDHTTWTHHHRVSPLHGSLNPVTAWQNLQNIAQVHFSGENDKIVPLEILISYNKFFPDGNSIIKTIHDYDHTCCWTNNWPALFNKALQTIH